VRVFAPPHQTLFFLRAAGPPRKYSRSVPDALYKQDFRHNPCTHGGAHLRIAERRTVFTIAIGRDFSSTPELQVCRPGITISVPSGELNGCQSRPSCGVRTWWTVIAKNGVMTATSSLGQDYRPRPSNFVCA